MKLLKPTLLSACAGMALIAGGCTSARELQQKDVHIAELEAQVATLKDRLANAQAPAPAPIVEAPVAAPADGADGMRAALEGTGAGVSMRGDNVVITMTNDILFRAGSASLSDSAKGTLRRVVNALKSQYPGKYVRIDGHTDNQPLVRTKDKWTDNWNLSGQRALSVLRELIDLGMDENLINFAGYGEFSPAASNSSRSGQASNRRVEIVVLQ